MDEELFRKFLVRDRKLTGSTPIKTIRNVRYLEKHHALEYQPFCDFTYPLIEQGKLNWYNKLIQAITHYWAFTGNPSVPPVQHTPSIKSRDVYSSDEIVSILQVAKPPFRLCLALLAHTGARHAEIRLLTAPQINFITNCITIHATKTKSERIVPIVEWLQAPLREFAKGKEGRIFDFTDTALYKELRRCCDKLGLRYRKVGCFRNAMITRQVTSNTPLFEVMALVGHTNPKTTLGYWVSNLDVLRKSVERDSLNIDHMTADQKLALLKKHLAEMVEQLKLDTDQSFDVHLDQKTNQISFTVKVKKEKTKSK